MAPYIILSLLMLSAVLFAQQASRLTEVLLYTELPISLLAELGAALLPGVLVFSPAAQPIGMIRLPEVCANICFGGAKRNRLFMVASQSLYAVYVGAVGAHIA